VTRLKRQQTFGPFRCCLDFLNVSLDSRSMFDVHLYLTIVSGFRSEYFKLTLSSVIES
jgi:hypothetical protein